jgi:cation-transporting ATPase E
LLGGFVLSFMFFNDIAAFIFKDNTLIFKGLMTRNSFFYLPLIYFSYYVHGFLGKVCRKFLDAYLILKKAGWTKKKAVKNHD